MDNKMIDESDFMQKIKYYSGTRLRTALIILTVLQFSIYPFMTSKLKTISETSYYFDYLSIYVASLYTVIVIGIFIFHTHGVNLFSDYFSLLIIALSCFFRFSIGGTHKLIYDSYMVFLGMALLVYVIKYRNRFNMPNMASVFIGLMWSIVAVVFIAIAEALNQRYIGIATMPGNLPAVLLKTFVYNLSFVTIIEEACFRGLILGFLIMNGCKENVAFLLQALLFWAIHWMSISNSVLFFIALPLLILSVTLLMKKYKIIFLPILMHTLVNVFHSIVVILVRRMIIPY